MKNILVVDDDKIFLKIFRDTIARDYKGVYEVRTAEDGEIGLKLVEDAIPDLIVLDIKNAKSRWYRISPNSEGERCCSTDTRADKFEFF
jgi:CheY-like chemotaxis protein